MAPKHEPAVQPTRLVIADVDGTLVTQDKVLTKRAIEAVMRLHESGSQFPVPYGRPPRRIARPGGPPRFTLPPSPFHAGGPIPPDPRNALALDVLPPARPP